MKYRVKVNSKLYAEIVRAVQDAADEIFFLSQQRVPVDKGTLKKSGGVEYLPTGAVIFYRTSYAMKQEEGVVAGTQEAIKKHSVKRHKRKLPQKTVWVTEHDRGPYTRVWKTGYPGKQYVGSSWDEIRPQITKHIQKRLDNG